MLMLNTQIVAEVLLGASLGLGLFIIFLLLSLVAICLPGFQRKSYKADLAEKKKKRRRH